MHLESLPQPYKLTEPPPRTRDLLGEAETVSLREGERPVCLPHVFELT